jgi:hypothetical protein
VRPRALSSIFRICYLRRVKGAFLLAALVAGCSLSLDESVKPDAGAGGTHASGGGGGTVASGGAWADGSATGGADASSDGSGATTSAGSAGAAGSTGGSAGSDAGSDAAGGNAGNASPGAVDCGASACDLTSQVCCHPVGGAGTCQDPNSCAAAIQCDSGEDCSAGLLCCLDNPFPVTVHCLTTCTAGIVTSAQFCKSDSECPTGKTCQPVTALIAVYVPASFQSCQ